MATKERPQSDRRVPLIGGEGQEMGQAQRKASFSVFCVCVCVCVCTQMGTWRSEVHIACILQLLPISWFVNFQTRSITGLDCVDFAILAS